jgi:hypothetical protein
MFVVAALLFPSGAMPRIILPGISVLAFRTDQALYTSLLAVALAAACTRRKITSFARSSENFQQKPYLKVG